MSRIDMVGISISIAVVLFGLCVYLFRELQSLRLKYQGQNKQLNVAHHELEAFKQRAARLNAVEHGVSRAGTHLGDLVEIVRQHLSSGNQVQQELQQAGLEFESLRRSVVSQFREELHLQFEKDRERFEAGGVSNHLQDWSSYEERRADKVVDDMASLSDSLSALRQKLETMEGAKDHSDNLQGLLGNILTASAETCDHAESGYGAVHETIEGAEKMRVLAANAQQKIDDLSNRIRGIGDVVMIIQEIAKKTNLLSLNAAIVAAKAGKHGRSFGVLASEIKALAERTAVSTQQIEEQAGRMETENIEVRQAVEQAVEAVETGFQQAVRAGDYLNDIRQSARLTQRKAQSASRNMEKAGSREQATKNFPKEDFNRLEYALDSLKDHSRRFAEEGQELRQEAERLLARLKTDWTQGQEILSDERRLPGGEHSWQSARMPVEQASRLAGRIASQTLKMQEQVELLDQALHRPQ